MPFVIPRMPFVTSIFGPPANPMHSATAELGLIEPYDAG